MHIIFFLNGVLHVFVLDSLENNNRNDNLKDLKVHILL